MLWVCSHISFLDIGALAHTIVSYMEEEEGKKRKKVSPPTIYFKLV